MIGSKGHGISKYVEDLTVAIGPNDPLTLILLKALGSVTLKEVRWVFIIQKDCPKNSPVRRFETIELNTSCYHPKSWLQIPTLLRSLKADLFFNPTFASYPKLPCPYVQTVHDLNHLWFGNGFQKLYYRILLRYSIKNAAAVLTVSKFVKTEIENWIQKPSILIQVIYNRIPLPITIESEATQKLLAQYGLKSKSFFLCVSNQKPHKNLELLLLAYESYRKKCETSPLPLVMTLHPSELVKSIEGVRAIDGVTDEALSVLYREAKAFFFPSSYEGFGRPPIEAALAGTPVYASDIPPHREGAEEFKLKIHFLDPKDQSAWAGAFANS